MSPRGAWSEGSREPAPELDPSTRQLLAEVCAGQRDEGDPAVRRAMQEPGARERLAELRAAAAALDAAGGTARRDLERAAGLKSAPGEERVATALRRLAAERPHGEAAHSQGGQAPRARWRRTALALGAAALLLAVVGVRWLAWRDPLGDGAPRLLGVDTLELVAPGPTFGDDLVFQWRGELAAGERFRVRVFDAADPLALEPALESPITTEDRWEPSDERATRLPDEIRWTLERVAPDGTARASAEGFSRRASR